MSTATQKAIDALELGMAMVGCPAGSNATSDAYRQMQEAIAALRTDHPNVYKGSYDHMMYCRTLVSAEDEETLADAIERVIDAAKAGQKATGRVLTNEEIQLINERAAQHRMHDGIDGEEGCADEFGNGAEWAARYILSNGYLAPQAPTTNAEQVDRIYDEVWDWYNSESGEQTIQEALRSRLTKLLHHED